MIDRSHNKIEDISSYSLHSKLCYIFFLLVISPCYSYSNSNREDLARDLIVYERDGMTYTTDGLTCPFGSYFYRESTTVECICSRGLWVFYESACGDPSLIHGSQNFVCSRVKAQLKKSILVSRHFEPTFSAFHPKNGMFFQVNDVITNTSLELNDGETIVVTGMWSMEFKNGQHACIGNMEDVCAYQSKSLPESQIKSVHRGCAANTYKEKTKRITIPKWNCTKFSKEKTDETCDEDLDDDTLAVDENSISLDSSRVKRSPSRPKARRAKKLGRVMMPSNLKMNEGFAANYNGALTPKGAADGNSSSNSTGSDDEDEEKVNREGSLLIKSEIWNYVTEAANDVLHLTTPRQTDTNIKIPSFKILDICKDIIKKACPHFYVPQSHWDLAVNIFRALQIRDINYDEPPVTLHDIVRIEKTLAICAENVTMFNFSRIDDANCSAFLQDSVLRPTTPSPSDSAGKFWALGGEQFLDVPISMAPNNREPIIETVWNIFVYAHSKCFPYFEQPHTSFNDHHRFTTLMMSLFTNGIVDIWKGVAELAPDIYSGFLGDARLLMSGVAHCTMTGKFDLNANDTDAQYPWDLIRPGGNSAGGGGSTPSPGAGASPAPAGRRKRSIEIGNPQAQLGCFTNIKENSFVCQE